MVRLNFPINEFLKIYSILLGGWLGLGPSTRCFVRLRGLVVVVAGSWRIGVVGQCRRQLGRLFGRGLRYRSLVF